jgi:hypothetical protein
VGPLLRVRGGNGHGTEQAIKGALAYADGALKLRIADSFVSIRINGQVRQRAQTPSARSRPSCDGAV